jgi:hypothetical protein
LRIFYCWKIIIGNKIAQHSDRNPNRLLKNPFHEVFHGSLK